MSKTRVGSSILPLATNSYKVFSFFYNKAKSSQKLSRKTKIINMNKLKSLNTKHFLLCFYSLIVLNYLSNIFKNSIFESLLDTNYFDMFSTILLFIFLYLVSKEISSNFKLPYISTGFVTYMFSFFLVDILTLFVFTGLTFSLLFIFVNAGWILLLIYKKANIKSFLFIISAFTFTNIYNNFFINSLSKNSNIFGDVKDIHFEHVKNIYTNSYFQSISNSSWEGYPQMAAYFHATLHQISISTIEFNYLPSSTNVLWLLSVLFIYESDLSRISKYVFFLSFSSLIFNSEWLKFLFIDSLMTEGVLSYLFCVALLSIIKSLKIKESNLYIPFILMGLLYFCKQFVSILSLFVTFYFLIRKKNRKFAILGFVGFLLKELSYLTYFKNVTKNFHYKELDLKDTFFDLILLRDLKLENFFIILKNLSKDIPLTLVLIYWLLLTIMFFYKRDIFEKDVVLFTFLISINFILIFILYISIWRNAELESPIRYILILLHLIFYSQFIIIDKMSES